MGATREQVLRRYGEPKSQMTTGNRLILFYQNERIVLRDDVVIEVEQLAPEAPRRPGETPTPPATTPGPGTGATGGTSDPTAPKAGAASPGPTGTPAPSTSAPAPEPKVEIKLVIPPSAKDSRPGPTPTTTPPPTSEPPPAKTPTSVTPEPANPAPPSGAPASTPAARPVETPSPAPPVEQPSAAETAAEKQAKEREAAEKRTKEKALRDARRRLDEAADADVTADVLTWRTYLLAAVIVVGGLGFLMWRFRQRQIELAATSVSNTPVTTPTGPAASSGTLFTAEMLETLDPKRFEEVVAAYYSKTGVVAARTQSGPANPVHIKISWKGEPRPFAYVQCIVHPAGLVDAKPLQELQKVLQAEDIRRGYVVTMGKFNVEARDFAEEKHLTLLPGDIFLEKLNALPASARGDIMRTLRGTTAPGVA